MCFVTLLVFGWAFGERERERKEQPTGESMDRAGGMGEEVSLVDDGRLRW